LAAGQLLGQGREAPVVFLEVGPRLAVAALVVFGLDQFEERGPSR
jgi:hypothetical protein